MFSKLVDLSDKILIFLIYFKLSYMLNASRAIIYDD